MGPPGPGARGPVEHLTWARARAPPSSRSRRNMFCCRKVVFFIVFGLKNIKIEGIRRFRWSDEIRCEKLHLLVHITPLETSFESSYDPNIMLMDMMMDDDG